MTLRTLLGQFPGGFYFDDEDGRLLDATTLWRRDDGSIGWYDGARFRKALRVDPWELLFPA